MIKKQRITREVTIYRDYPQEGEEASWRRFIIYGEIGPRFIRMALSIPAQEFAEKFVKESKPLKKKKNLMNVLEIKDPKGKYAFYENTGGTLRSWESDFGGIAQIEPPFEGYRLEPKKYQKMDPPATISSKNIDNANAQKNLVLMLKKYVRFLENYHHLKL